jgi:hypothetical protein
LAFGSLASVFIAYFGPASNDVISASATLESLQLDEEVATALRGRRGTAGAFSLAFATLLLFVIVGPYRKGACWAWWAILCSTAVLAGTMMLRVPVLGTWQGASTGGLLFVLVAVGLLLDVKRLSTSQGS